MQQPPNGVAGGALALFAIYLPTFFMTAGSAAILETPCGLIRPFSRPFVESTRGSWAS